MSDGPWRSHAFAALTPAGRRLFECVNRQLDGRHEVAVSRTQFRELANLSRASVSIGTRQVTTLGLLAVSTGPRSVHVYRRNDEWRGLSPAEVAERRARLPQRRPPGRVKAPMRWPTT